MPDGRPRLYSPHSPGHLHQEHRGPRRLVSNARGLKVFSLWNAVADSTAAATPALTRSERLDCEELPGLLVPRHMEGDGQDPPEYADGPLNFILNLTAREVIREDASSALGPLDREEINRLLAAGAAGAHRGSRLKARLSFGSQNIRNVDFGQSIRMSAVARYLSVAVLLPEQSIISPVSADRLGPTLVLDTLFTAEIMATYAPPGDRLATFTTTIAVGAGAVDSVVRLQPGARRVTVYQGSVGGVFTPFFSLDDIGAAAGPNLGAIVLGASRRAVGLDIPGHAQVILSGPADGDAGRVLTVVQSLEI